MSNSSTETPTDTTSLRPQRRRWRFLPRFGLRWLLILTTVVCLGMTAWSIYIDPFRRQSVAVARIRQLGGEVGERTATGPDWQRWMVETFLGKGSFSEAHQVSLHEAEIHEDIRAQLGRLPFVEELKFDGAGIDDRTVAALMPGEHVKSLSLRYTRVTDASMNAAARFPHLETLMVTGADVTDAGLATLTASPALEQLFIRWTNVTDQGIADFRNKCPKCEVSFHVQ